jgi:glutathione S-transferase
MITLYKFGAYFGLPDASPFCIKSEALLKIAGLDYETDVDGFNKAPKGKQPYLRDDGELIADSTFVRLHIENKYGFNFDAGLDSESAGIAWAVEKMCEDHLYWVIVIERWKSDANFDRGPRVFFDPAPALIRPLLVRSIRKKVLNSTKAHGLGRHSDAEIHILAKRGIAALASILGNNKYLMGDKICGADATAYAFLDCLSCKHFESPVISMVDDNKNLAAYRDRMRQEWFPDAI